MRISDWSSDVCSSDLLEGKGDRMTADYLNGCRAGIAERAPDGPAMTGYDRVHTLTYARLLDAERDGHDWTDVAAEMLDLDVAADRAGAKACRSEEHTSELQSLMRISYAVFCLHNKKTTH